MTIPSTLTGDRTSCHLAGCGIEVRWPARPAAAGPVELVVTLELVDDEHAIIESWMETTSDRRTIVARQVVPTVVTHVETQVHIDVVTGDRRLLALTLDGVNVLAPTRIDTASSRLLYAQSCLPAEAGLAPGAYDPPTARLDLPKQDAATA